MGVGGPARFLVEAADEQSVLDALDWAKRRRLRLLVLGGGSNLLVSDAGVDALVLKIALRGVSVTEAQKTVEVTAAAGEPWDDLVRLTVERDWAGLECLSGIPGLVGATPIQNVGAYGQDVSNTVVSVRVVDTRTTGVADLPAQQCGFTYRDSVFKSGEPGRYIVLGVRYRLTRDGPPTVAYTEVARHLETRGVSAPRLRDVRESVVAIRRSKSMVIERDDPNRRSCGSFFTNPIVAADDVAAIEARAGESPMPRWPQPDGRVKLSAAWLIERAGFTRGSSDGAVGLSTRHALAIVAHDGARASDVLRFARRVQDAVRARFGVMLTPEPVFWGFSD
jgi:UDP-N-acetylmuramate dehydrogenase